MTEPNNPTPPEHEAASESVEAPPAQASELAIPDAKAAAPAPAKARPNPFKLLAGVFRDLRRSIEEADGERPPRWVRIARARNAIPGPVKALSKADTDTPAKDGQALVKTTANPAKKSAGRSPEAIMSDGIGALLGGFISALSFIAELVLDLQEILIQVDAGKALIEISADLAMAVTSENFTSGVKSLTSVEPNLGSVNEVFDKLKKLVAYAPEKEDLDCVSHELFLLLRVVHREVDGTMTLDIEDTGKIRLLQWAYGRSYTILGLGFDEQGSCPSQQLGARSLAQTTPSPTTTAAYEGEKVLDVDFEGDTDIAEVRTILTLLGYLETAQEATPPDLAQMRDAINLFQETNGLEANGLVDDATLNRLNNLDSANELLCRALPRGAKRQPRPAPERLAGKVEVQDKPADPTPADPEAQDKPKPADDQPAVPKSGDEAKDPPNVVEADKPEPEPKPEAKSE